MEALPDVDARQPGSSPSDEEAPGAELFGTETMAELCARQGRVADAVAIYRRLVRRGDPGDARQARFRERLAALERALRANLAAGTGAGRRPPVAARVEPVAEAPVAAAALPAPPQAIAAPVAIEPHRLPLVVTQPVRGGQIVRAERTDVVVLAPVNPGAEVVADGHVHVYAALRGRAHAGAAGQRDARVFCQRLEAELVSIAGVTITFDELPRACIGKPAQIFLRDGRCVVAPL
jgi:septum formation inhibitor MinC